MIIENIWAMDSKSVETILQKIQIVELLYQESYSLISSNLPQENTNEILSNLTKDEIVISALTIYQIHGELNNNIHNSLGRENDDFILKSDARNIWIWRCLSSATRYTAARSIYADTIALGRLTAGNTLRIFKLIGRRYLGYIGLANAIYSFTKCIKEHPCR